MKHLCAGMNCQVCLWDYAHDQRSQPIREARNVQPASEFAEFVPLTVNAEPQLRAKDFYTLYPRMKPIT